MVLQLFSTPRFTGIAAHSIEIMFKIHLTNQRKIMYIAHKFLELKIMKRKDLATLQHSTYTS